MVAIEEPFGQGVTVYTIDLRCTSRKMQLFTIDILLRKMMAVKNSGSCVLQIREGVERVAK
jgi:hypothetical protein